MGRLSPKNIYEGLVNPVGSTRELSKGKNPRAVLKDWTRANLHPIESAAEHIVGTKSRQNKNRDQANVDAAAAAIKEQEAILMGKYNAEDLDPDNQANIDRYKQIQTMNLNRALATMGATDSSGKYAAGTAISSGAAELEAGIRAKWWLAAMKLHGMNEASAEWLDKLNEVDRSQRIVDFSNLLQSVGAVSIFYQQMQK